MRRLLARKDVDFLIDHPGSVLAVCISNDQSKVLMVSVSREGSSISLELPGGTIESGESPATAVVREALEEAGLAVSNAAPLIKLTTSAGITNEVVHVFRCTGNIVSSGEFSAFWVPLSEIWDRIRSQDIRASTTIAALYALAHAA